MIENAGKVIQNQSVARSDTEKLLNESEGSIKELEDELIQTKQLVNE